MSHLSARANSVALEAARVDKGGLPLLHLHSLLSAEASGTTWRLVELVSRDGLPFEAHLAWSAGSGSGASLRLTAARAARVALLASSLQVRVGNLAAQDQRVSVTVADGYAPTHNHLEVRGPITPTAPLVAEVPNFATSCRAEVADLAALASAELRLLDATSQPLTAVALLLQPPEGLALGTAHRAELRSPQTPTLGRLLFHLAL